MTRDEREELIEMLEPFHDFQKAIEERPINGLDPDDMYGIHGGRHVQGGANLSWKDVKRAAEMYRRLVLSPKRG